MRQIDYYLTIASPWSYLGHAALMEIARKHGAQVHVKPAMFGAIFDETGGLPFGKRHPARQRYRNIDLQRWRIRRGIDLHLFPTFWPFDVAVADKVVVAAVMAGHAPDALIRRCFAGVWGRQQNLADPDTLAAILAETGLPGDLLDASRTPAVAERYSANVGDAVASGVFGAPAYVLDGEVFWGQDRLDLLDEALTSGRAPFAGVDAP
jgi:2-hydroxychromene-2-carboxylate isomerase